MTIVASAAVVDAAGRYVKPRTVRYANLRRCVPARMTGRTDMLAELIDRHDAIVELCCRFGVTRLAVFGSASSGEFDPSTSDVDFLVELSPPAGISRFDAYFGLKEALEPLLGRPVDLVDPSALDNPYFAKSVELSRRELYAA